ncbi:PREDICTED: TMV resistance protein N-like [Populus euphratica]|uniref:TMV resistance protein N-like n=1 Tax=Populus euphratica TaxID=75702 RepID=A0AAJ6TMY2_POPEU|nr:PREDICTED: TMV resistance protein N-like [Populus euphratica]
MAAASSKSQLPEVSSSTSRCSYHVFLSFRGKDTRKNFTDHLYTALVQAGLHTFRDDNEIRRGEHIDYEIQKSIHESKIFIVVFSKDYASSRWCLDELLMIMKRRKICGLIVLPVFYHMDPSKLSEHEAFDCLEEEKDGRVEAWKAALREVANLGGMVLQDGYTTFCFPLCILSFNNTISN